MAYFALEATSAAGEALATDRFYFSSVGTHTANDHTVLTLRGQLQTLTWMIGAPDELSEKLDQLADRSKRVKSSFTLQ